MVSIDKRNFSTLLNEAVKSFPEGIEKHIETIANEKVRGSHVQGDIFALPIKENSVDFLSCVEGWPFFFRNLPFEEPIESRKKRIRNKGPVDHKTIAENVMRVLKPGGVAVFFPWHIRREGPINRQRLEMVEKYWKEQGMIVTKVEHDVADLLMSMNEREYNLTFHSPLFDDTVLGLKGGKRKTLTVLAVEKPYEMDKVLWPQAA